MDITNEPTGEVRLSGPLTIRRTAELRDALLSALASQQIITLDLPDEADADISFVQLVLALQASARASGRQVQLSRPSGGALRTVLEQGGFLAADETGFWTKGTLPQ